MTRSELTNLPEYFDRYILKCDDVTIAETFDIAIAELDNAPLDKWRALGNRTYAEGKWTIKEILQHLIDTERVFAYRALAFARGETAKLPSFDEDSYAKNSEANRRTLEDLIAELRHSHQSMQLMYLSFTPEMLERKGMGWKGEYSVAAIAYTMGGHQRWHFGILEERYYGII